MLFSPLAEAIVLFCVPAVFWHMLMIQVAARVSIRRRVLVGALMLGWTALSYASVRHGFDEPLFPGSPGRPFVILAIAAGLTWAFRERLLGQGVPQQLLITLQLFRPIGLIFLWEEARGTLPWTFAFPAGWGDLIAGLVALGVLVRHPTGSVPPRAVLLVAVVGGLDFASAFFFGLTSSATPLQLFAFDNPNRVLEYPLGLIPLFLVPYAIMAHLLSLAQLALSPLPPFHVIANPAGAADLATQITVNLSD
jgi:hypothetical protein